MGAAGEKGGIVSVRVVRVDLGLRVLEWRKAWNNLLEGGRDAGDSSRARGVVRRAGAACSCQLVASNGITLIYQDGLQLMTLLEIIQLDAEGFTAL